MWPKGPPESASYQQGGVLLYRESLALILSLVTLSELLLLRRTTLLGTSVNKAASASVYTRVDTFSELGKERMRSLGQSPSSERVQYGG